MLDENQFFQAFAIEFYTPTTDKYIEIILFGGVYRKVLLNTDRKQSFKDDWISLMLERFPLDSVRLGLPDSQILAA